jgi:hypothetical protein
MNSTRYSFNFFTKFEFSRQTFEKSSHIKFRENPSNGSRVVHTKGQTWQRKYPVFAMLSKCLNILPIQPFIKTHFTIFFKSSITWQNIFCKIHILKVNVIIFIIPSWRKRKINLTHTQLLTKIRESKTISYNLQYETRDGLFIHLVVCLTASPKPLPKRVLHIVRSKASSFKWEYTLLSLRLSSSFLRLLPRLLVTSISPFIFPSRTCCRRQFLRKMWPKCGLYISIITIDSRQWHLVRYTWHLTSFFADI